MKKISLLLLGFCLLLNLHAQTQDLKAPDSTKVFIGVSTGFNNFVGMLGVNIAVRANNQLFIRGGLGSGGWGSKFSIGIKYDKKPNSPWAYCLGLSSMPGMNGLKQSLTVKSGTKKDVSINYKSATTLNLSMLYTKKISGKFYFNTEIGYALPLKAGTWEIPNGEELSSDSEKTLDLTRPGGMILGVGFSFGL